jgi:hypothetical protein
MDAADAHAAETRDRATGTFAIPEPAAAEERARALGEHFARTVGGLADVVDGDPRFRLRTITVGQCVVDLHDPTDGRHLATLREHEHGWAVHGVGVAGEAFTNRATFAAAVGAGELAGAVLSVPFPAERPATLDDMRRAWPDQTDEELINALAAIERAGGRLDVVTGE